VSKKKKEEEIRLYFNNYIGKFYRKDKRGVWYKFHTIGNTGIAMDVAGLLMKMGHTVEFIQERINEDD
jgi:hypothetical protein